MWKSRSLSEASQTSIEFFCENNYPLLDFRQGSGCAFE